MESYHGTSAKFIKDLVGGKIVNDKGSGELGKGFYTGERLYLAKQWAYNKHDRSTSVLVLQTNDIKVEQLDILIMDYSEATAARREIKKNETTQSHEFNVDMVWSPIVGTTKKVGEQYKWESQRSMDLLNGKDTTRKTI
ncbi:MULTISPECIES: hypothetical protein [Vibrio]|jgi:hypothetical protein|uniref:hypothetical protein n=1 Tax=Vibrio TaxID=662 RepID=UPI001BD54347|nr:MULTISPECIES: hypothetical protein [Vibrio]EGQ8093407.1 DUF3990 domain-containing protein [Vibrio vulnificus]EJE8531393.1 hypothetical protein [Vibrio parahaemolyticus]HDM8135382.1 hypothetical protein [Vibrio harveyi]EGQ9099406.1 hypothetical protein [Vibrio alginolyticus]EHD2253208.1 DUF3990 domain-containing protein [Vibrio vulnificus]